MGIWSHLKEPYLPHVALKPQKTAHGCRICTSGLFSLKQTQVREWGFAYWVQLNYGGHDAAFRMLLFMVHKGQLCRQNMFLIYNNLRDSTYPGYYIISPKEKKKLSLLIIYVFHYLLYKNIIKPTILQKHPVKVAFI